MSSNVLRNTPLLSYEEIEFIFESVLEDISETSNELFSIDLVANAIGRDMEAHMKHSVSVAVYNNTK